MMSSLFDDVNPGAIVTSYLPNLPLYHCFGMMSPSWAIVTSYLPYLPLYHCFRMMSPSWAIVTSYLPYLPYAQLLIPIYS